MSDALEQETTDVLQRLLRFNTVNPPGDERAAQEFLAEYCKSAGFEVELLGAAPERPNLIATLRGDADGPTLVYLGHVDTVLANASEWAHDPWSGDLVEGFLWGRGAIDMKSQVAAEAAAGVSLARNGWRPAAGTLKLVFVADEETGGDLGAQWLTANHPAKVRCDVLINEGGGAVFDYNGRRLYGVCCGEKGVFRFSVTASGVAGHASLPRMGDNALLKLGPVLTQLAAQQPSFDVTAGPAALLRDIGEDPEDPAGALRAIASVDPRLLVLIEPMLGVTLTPTMAHASDKINVIPSHAQIRVDCRVPPGLGEDVARERIGEVLGDLSPDLRIDFIDSVIGNVSDPQSPLMDTISRWVAANDPGAAAVPVILPGFSDSRWFREAFPECVAYGFFPHRHMNMFEVAPLVHSADERIDVRDLGFAARCYADVARELLG
jgi:acetylornithine deacetylase/succinyl-diaminopimelate desuccinylase-like protein